MNRLKPWRAADHLARTAAATLDQHLRIAAGGRAVEGELGLRDPRLQALRDNPECAQEEYDNLLDTRSPGLNAVLGVRMDMFDGGSPDLNPNFVERYGFANTTGFSDIDPVFLPRIGFTYDLNEFTVDNWTNVCGPAGLCDALFRALPFIAPDDDVLVGLPDTVWFPADGFRSLPADVSSVAGADALAAAYAARTR